MQWPVAFLRYSFCSDTQSGSSAQNCKSYLILLIYSLFHFIVKLIHCKISCQSIELLLVWLGSYDVGMAWLIRCRHGVACTLSAWLVSYAVGMACIVQCWYGLANTLSAWLGAYAIGMAWIVLCWHGLDHTLLAWLRSYDVDMASLICC